MFNKWTGVLRRLSTIPVPAVLFVLALGLFLWGAYVVSPVFQPGPAITVAFHHNRLVEYLFGFIYIAIGLVRMGGVKKKSLLLAGPYIIMMGYLFLAILEIVVVGWYPLTWAPLMICAVISGICRLALVQSDAR